MDAKTIKIPAVEYVRPNGVRNLGGWLAPYSDELRDKIKELIDCNIEITVELVFGNMVNVCFDDGDFDYKYELIPNDSELVGHVTDLVLAFDKEDYLAKRKSYVEYLATEW